MPGPTSTTILFKQVDLADHCQDPSTATAPSRCGEMGNVTPGPCPETAGEPPAMTTAMMNFDN